MIPADVLDNPRRLFAHLDAVARRCQAYFLDLDRRHYGRPDGNAVYLRLQAREYADTIAASLAAPFNPAAELALRGQP